ncbi:hypothetical protein HRI_003222600 [Hibiscus trionum]|uniref:DUF7890 domain-containing protein n=1 Tax=Hibiscus trionum TaxID=183268 RepID=A0A9W7IHQ3_HIBTR|nr:hypothetical protein HRI_003222600 [Hibiscus trionum]
MLTFIAACFCKVLCGEIIEFGESKTKSTSNFICRDELSKTKGDSFSSREEMVKVKDPKMRIKVKMTREEAARLLSRCKEGGIIEFKDVASQLVNLPMNRVTVVSPCSAAKPLLHSIPEEY